MSKEAQSGKAAKIDMPPQYGTFKQAQRVKQGETTQQGSMGLFDLLEESS